MSICSEKFRQKWLCSVALVVLASACGVQEPGAERVRNSQGVSPTVVDFERSTSCTNFSGAYNADMGDPNAAVTMTFCPDATSYVASWANGNVMEARISPEKRTLRISGSDFVNFGPLSVRVYRDVAYPSPESIINVPLGDFALRVELEGGQARLKGTWYTTLQREFMESLGRGPVSLESLVSYVGYQFDSMYWFERNRCSPEPEGTESEKFNLQFSVSGRYLSVVQAMGSAQVAAKNAQASLAGRRSVFRRLNLLQQEYQRMLEGSPNGYLFNSATCVAVDQPAPPPLSPEKAAELKELAPKLRELSRTLDARLCSPDSTTSDDGSLRGEFINIFNAVSFVPDPENHPEITRSDATLWSQTSEPDREALEVAQWRLYIHLVVSENLTSGQFLYSCPWSSWGHEVLSAAAAENYWNPTTTTSSTTTSNPPDESNSVESNSAGTVPDVVVPTSGGEQLSAPSTTQVATDSNVVPPSSPVLTVGSSVKVKALALLAGLKVMPRDFIKVTILRPSGKVCRAQKGAVKGLKAGVCKMSIVVRTPGKDRRVSTLSLDVSTKTK